MLRAMWFWGLVILGSACSLGLYWLTEWPLGVPGEWTWGRFDVTPDLLANALLCLATGAAYLIFVTRGYRRLARPECRRSEAVAWQVGLAVMAGVWIWMVQGTGATGASIARWPFVLYYPSSSGYFFKARYESPSARELLKNYESLMKDGDVLHVGTHPPGLFLYFHGLIGLVEAIPGFSSAINVTQPETVREAFEVVVENQRKSAPVGPVPVTPLTENDRAVIWLAALIAFGLTAATVWPIYGFARQHADRPASWLAACTWPLVPAISVFLPKSDVAFAFPAMLLGGVWLVAWRRRSVALASLAGALWSISMLCSLAFLPVALWLALLSLLESWHALQTNRVRDEFQRALRTIVPAGIVCFGLMGALSLWGQISLGKTFWLNYLNHAGFYSQYPRTYLAWLTVNPIEVACAVGAPLFVLAAVSIGGALIHRQDDVFRRWTAPCLATMVVWLWLWISGKNSGEAARLWIFLMPYLTVCTAAVWSRPSAATPQRLPWIALGWMACQMLVCFWTVQRINGFTL